MRPERRGSFCCAATATAGLPNEKPKVAESSSSSWSMLVGGVVADVETATSGGVVDFIADLCRMQRLTFHRFPLVSQTVLPAALAISNGSENTGEYRP